MPFSLQSHKNNNDNNNNSASNKDNKVQRLVLAPGRLAGPIDVQIGLAILVGWPAGMNISSQRAELNSICQEFNGPGTWNSVFGLQAPRPVTHRADRSRQHG